MTGRGGPVDRRAVVAGVGAGATLSFGALAFGALAPVARATPARDAAVADPLPLVPSAQFEDAYAQVVGQGTPVETRVTLELPDDAENGNIVPYKIVVESPMTPDDYIARVHLLSTQNPQASVAVFHFTPASGRAAVSGRMRLAKTQEVVAVALTSGNSLLIARRKVEVGIGGCGSE